MSEEIKGAALIPEQRRRIAELEAAVDRAQTAEKAWTEIGARSQADAVALRAICTGLLECFDHGDPWTKQARANAAAALRDVLAVDHPGAALLAELAAARAVVEALQAGIARDGYCPICHQTERMTLQTGYYTHHDSCALAAYQAARKGATVDG